MYFLWDIKLLLIRNENVEKSKQGPKRKCNEMKKPASEKGAIFVNSGDDVGWEMARLRQ